jgi:hypothetical protein
MKAMKISEKTTTRVFFRLLKDLVAKFLFMEQSIDKRGFNIVKYWRDKGFIQYEKNKNPCANASTRLASGRNG